MKEIRTRFQGGVMEVIKSETIVGNTINVYGDNDNPLFLAKDVAKWIEWKGTSQGEFVKMVDEEERVKIYSDVRKVDNPTKSMPTNRWFLTEQGVYEVFFRSNLPRAKQFKKWVKDILQDIRKTGMYATDHLLDNPDLMIQAMEKLKEERAKRKALESKIEEDAPRVSFAETIEKASDSILIRDFSKILGNEGIKLGQNKLYDKLREYGYIFKNSTNPTQRAIDQGLFKVSERIVTTVKGDITSFTTKITGKGQIFLLNKIKKEMV